MGEEDAVGAALAAAAVARSGSVPSRRPGRSAMESMNAVMSGDAPTARNPAPTSSVGVFAACLREVGAALPEMPGGEETDTPSGMTPPALFGSLAPMQAIIRDSRAMPAPHPADELSDAPSIIIGTPPQADPAHPTVAAPDVPSWSGLPDGAAAESVMPEPGLPPVPPAVAMPTAAAIGFIEAGTTEAATEIAAVHARSAAVTSAEADAPAPSASGDAGPLPHPAPSPAATEDLSALARQGPPADASLPAGSASYPPALPQPTALPASPRPTPATPARQVLPVVVAMAVGGGTARLSVTLEPAELGRVEISVERTAEAQQVTVLAERPETLALLQRDQRELDRALSQAGLGEGRAIAFGLAQDDAARQGRSQGKGRNERHLARGLQTADASKDAAAQPAPRALLSLIDLAV